MAETITAANNRALIEQFYSCFARGDAAGMLSCYSDDIVFEDPAFGVLHGEDARKMWRMLIEKSKGQLKIVYSGIQADAHTGTAKWTATYPFSKTGRQVVNKIDASFVFEQGKIKKHKDHFNFWLWSKQALGMPGLLLGWTSMLQQKVRKNALAQLQAYSNKRNNS